MLSLNQEIAKRIHNAQLDSKDDYSLKGYAKTFGLSILDGVIDGLIIGGAIVFVRETANSVIKSFKKKKG